MFRSRSDRCAVLGSFLTVTLALALLLTTGCGPRVPLAPVPTAGATPVDPSGFYTPTGSSTAGSLQDPGTSLGGMPGPIGGTGSWSGPSPLTALPAPAEAAAEIERVCQRFGIKSIRGSLASSEFVRKLENACARFPSGSFQNLDIVVEATPTAFLQEGTPAWWEPLNASGQSLLFDANGQFLQDGASNGPEVAGRITYTNTNLGTWTLVHEMGHHLTTLVDVDFARRLSAALGYTRTGGPAPIDGYSYLTGQFDKSRVPAQSFPTEYSKSDTWIGEHLAELISVQLAGNETEGWVKRLPGYSLPAAARGVLDSKFGSGVSAD